ncbi:polyphosphate polymerase domain-containing protein [Anaerobaca lacustris]|uniref:Polyphosphate polymerase domain-containing protein n=1 Tax=Anaerobaca lacustris TaxID=3044600 RepID=A0AAW6U5L7_9BACT|nr:polyphosphate polymerase domain-containing protein [Sedimentisphaerales bacterium M17dextr]
MTTSQTTGTGDCVAESAAAGKDRPALNATKSGDRMLACRFELKYLIMEATAAAIEKYIRPFLEYDRYSKLQRGGMYPIVSLYCDSQDMQLCRETLTGVKNRFKLRIRSYTDEPEYPRFFEIKRRINQVIVKSRARVMDEDVAPLLAGRQLPPRGYTTDEAALNQFQLYAASIHAGPRVLIRYMRQAFENTTENRVRVTFDRDLCYKVTDKPIVRLGGSGWQRNVLTEGYVILEIKFTGTFPTWLSRMAALFGLRARSVSKFATSIEQACALGYCAPVLRNGWYG